MNKKSVIIGGCIGLAIGLWQITPFAKTERMLSHLERDILAATDVSDQKFASKSEENSKIEDDHERAVANWSFVANYLINGGDSKKGEDYLLEQQLDIGDLVTADDKRYAKITYFMLAQNYLQAGNLEQAKTYAQNSLANFDVEQKDIIQEYAVARQAALTGNIEQAEIVLSKITDPYGQFVFTVGLTCGLSEVGDLEHTQMQFENGQKIYLAEKVNASEYELREKLFDNMNQEGKVCLANVLYANGQLDEATAIADQISDGLRRAEVLMAKYRAQLSSNDLEGAESTLIEIKEIYAQLNQNEQKYLLDLAGEKEVPID